MRNQAAGSSAVDSAAVDTVDTAAVDTTAEDSTAVHQLAADTAAAAAAAAADTADTAAADTAAETVSIGQEGPQLLKSWSQCWRSLADGRSSAVAVAVADTVAEIPEKTDTSDH